jgi:hypothetical protein
VGLDRWVVSPKNVCKIVKKKVKVNKLIWYGTDNMRPDRSHYVTQCNVAEKPCQKFHTSNQSKTNIFPNRFLKFICRKALALNLLIPFTTTPLPVNICGLRDLILFILVQKIQTYNILQDILCILGCVFKYFCYFILWICKVFYLCAFCNVV